MASWSAIPALTGFLYSGVSGEIRFADISGKYFWSNGYSYGTVEISKNDKEVQFSLNVLNGSINISKITIEGFGSASTRKVQSVKTGEVQTFTVYKSKS